MDQVISIDEKYRIWGTPRAHGDDRNRDIESFLRGTYGEGPFSYLDLCCGNGDVLIYLATAFPMGIFIGVDIVHPDLPILTNLTFYQEPFQTFIARPDKYSVVSLLDTYRNWPEEFRKDQEDFHRWLSPHTDYFICSLANIKDLDVLPFKGTPIGRDSHGYPLILCQLP